MPFHEFQYQSLLLSQGNDFRLDTLTSYSKLWTHYFLRFILFENCCHNIFFDRRNGYFLKLYSFFSLDTTVFNDRNLRPKVVLSRAVENSKKNANGSTSIVAEKQIETKDASDVYQRLENQLKPRFTTHAFNIIHQYKTIQKMLPDVLMCALKSMLPDNHAIIHISFDVVFSEKYWLELFW